MRFAIAVLPLPEVPTTTTRIGFCSLVSRFRSSHHCAAHSFANFGIKGTLEIYDSSAVFGFEVPTQTRGYNDRNFKSIALESEYSLSSRSKQYTEATMLRSSLAAAFSAVLAAGIAQSAAAQDAAEQRLG